MRFFFISLLTLAGMLFNACQKDEFDLNRPTEINDNFDNSMMDWSGDFADYPAEGDTDYGLSLSLENLPEPLDQSKKGIRVSGINRSDDLFMFIKKKVSGLKANQSYHVNMEVQLASNAPSDHLGVGGAPGESVYFGIGLSDIEPVKVVDPTDGYYRMNIDKMQQSQDGEAMKVIGNIANGTEESSYVMLSKTGEFTGMTDEDGNIWLIVGTDSGFESETTLYYSSVKAKFTEL